MEQIDVTILVKQGESVDAVVLAFDKTLDFEKMCRAHNYLNDPRVQYFATHPDFVCPMINGTIPDCGAMIALFEASCGNVSHIVGNRIHISLLSFHSRRSGI